MRLITLDDFIDVYVTAKKRGWQFISSKFNPSAKARTQSAFNETVVSKAHWFMVPAIRKRWNTLITGNPSTNYKQWLMQTHFKEYTNLKLLSLGSGSCGHEIELAQYANFEKITCVDLAPNRIEAGKQRATKLKLTNMEFRCASIDELAIEAASYDVVLFNSSLHHFKHVDRLVGETIHKWLAPNGFVIINEYVGKNRQQFGKAQRKAINEALKSVPKKYRKRIKTNLYKNHFYGAGWLRMYLADPSECVESEAIVPSLKKHYNTIGFKPYGGNVLTHVLKDIAHHFIELNDETEAILDRLMAYEDAYLQEHDADFVFGLFQKKA